jgi:hypothetical protein
MSDRRPKYYKLLGRVAVPVRHMMDWAVWFEKNGPCHVAQDVVGSVFFVSTIFLGLDHNFSGVGDPLLFETMILDTSDSDGFYQTRCSTWGQAEAEHARALEIARVRWAAAERLLERQPSENQQ